MRTTLVHLAILAGMAAAVCTQASTAKARGPLGGTPNAVAPSMGGARGGHGGSMGFSFGSGGINFGGGAGRITIGSSGRGVSTSSLNLNRHQVPVLPNVHVVPAPRLPDPVPLHVPSQTWSTPQPEFRPPALTDTPTTPQIQPNELPANPSPQPIATDPQVNPSGLVGRQITETEVERSRKFFQRNLLELAQLLEKRLPPADYDPEQLVAVMVEHSVPVASQIRIVDALKRGDFDEASRIWVAVVPRVEIPFKPSRTRVLFLRFYLMIERGHLSYPIVEELLGTLPPEAVKASTCCGADDLLVQIEEEIRVSEAIGGLVTEAATPQARAQPNAFSDPQQNMVPQTYASAEIEGSRFAGKPNPFEKPGGAEAFQPYGRPGEQVAIPAGPVNIVYHPKLPDRQVVVVNAQTVMIGTGGRGVFRMERGYAAEALGHRVGRGTPLAANQSELVHTGVVIVNPTRVKVGFVFGRHEVSLEPGYQQAFADEGIISFDRGGGKKTTRYSLEPGTYEFTADHDGWDLHSRKYAVTLSNEGNRQPFHYIVQGQRDSLADDEQKTHTGSYPILIRFDRGDGSATRQIRWDDDQGTVQVAVNPADNLWDLFAAGEPEQAKSPLQPTPDFVPAF